MKQLALSQSMQRFKTLFASAKHEMFKAEVLQDYTAIDDCPSLRAWFKGNRQEARELGKTDPQITSYCKQCLASPAAITRVHVVRRPYTPYLEWEIAVCYKDSLRAHKAESILLVPCEKIARERLPQSDFWIFDNTRVLQWKYDRGSGRITGARLWDEGCGDDIASFRQLQKILLDAGKALE